MIKTLMLTYRNGEAKGFYILKDGKVIQYKLFIGDEDEN